MLVVTSREFREHQKEVFEKVDNGIQVIVKRGKSKAYALTPISENDNYFTNPQIIERLKHSIAQATEGKTVTVKKEDISALLGLK